MALDDVVFSLGDSQNFIVETPGGQSGVPIDILTLGASLSEALCLETVFTAAETSGADLIMLTDGKIAKRLSNTVYLKLP